MPAPSVNFLVNKSATDTPPTNPAGDTNFLLVASGDILCWRDAQQAHNDSISGAAYPVLIPASGSNEGEKTFLKDLSAGVYIQIPLAGTVDGGQSGGNTRYVFAAYFDAATATTPYLEAWDTDAHSTAVMKALGNGTAGDSCFSAIATTGAAPGSTTWTGTKLAGSGSRVDLNSGALSGAQYVYWNMKMVIPSTAAAWSTSDRTNTGLTFALHYTYS